MLVRARSLLSTGTGVIDAVSPSESVSLQGHKAKTPIIAGSICGGVMFIAYIAILTVYLMKRRRRREMREKVAAGLQPPPQEDGPVEHVVIPPDPAVVLGLRRPGEHVTPPSSDPPCPTHRRQSSNTTSFVSNPPLPTSIAKDEPTPHPQN